jgi:tetratricopeptide (TPR) repeat protein
MKNVLLLAPLLTLAACATTTAVRPTTPVATARPAVRGEEFRVVGEGPHSTGDAYDAALLFERATEHLRAGRCDEALADYDRLLREFPDNFRTHPTQFNRALCLQRAQRLPDAADAMRAAAASPSDPTLVRDAWFRVAVLGEQAQQPGWVVEATDALLRHPRIDMSDRVEALARRAAALLARNEREAAERAALQAIEIAPTPELVASLGDDTYAAQARVLLAEVTRVRAAEVIYRVEETNAEEAITRRVQLVTHAHALFNDAIRVGNPHWAAAAGFRIGEMYRDLYHAIVDAPVPADWSSQGREVYRRRTSERLRPLLQGAMRSWEATLIMARRNSISNNEWVRRADEALADLRALILGEPAAPRTPPRPAAPPGNASPSTVRPAA